MTNEAAPLHKITVRGRGPKSHPAYQRPFESGKPGFHIRIACSCPGSQNGALANKVAKCAEGWERATCDNF